MSYTVLKKRGELRDFEIFREAEASESDFTQKALTQKIDWKSYSLTHKLEEQQLGLIIDIYEGDDEQKGELMDEMGVECCQAFCQLLEAISTKTVKDYLLVVVDRLLQEDLDRVRYFIQLQEKDMYSPFTVSKATRILAILLASNTVEDNPQVQDFTTHLLNKIGRSKQSAELIHTVGALKELLKSSANRSLFAREGGVACLTSLMERCTHNTQLLYLLGFCFWLLSFDASVVNTEFARLDIVRRLVEILRTVVREKVVRIVFAVLANLVESEFHSDSMVANGLAKLLPTVSARKWNDEDVIKSIDLVEEHLRDHIRILSSFEKYAQEVTSHRLSWSPVHSAKFWREHVNKFEEDNFKLIKLLCELLDSEDNLTVEVACYDLGEFARFHPDGKRLLTRFKGKDKLMQKMASDQQKIAKQALMAVQKLMVHNWESLSGNTEKK